MAKTKYAIDIKKFEAKGFSFTYAVRERMRLIQSYAHVKGSTENSAGHEGDHNEEPPGYKEMMQTIAELHPQHPEYVSVTTPILEALFRIFLARENRPATAEELEEALISSWANKTYLRPISMQFLTSVLESPNFYCMTTVKK